MTGITKDELMQMAHDAGLIDFYNAILERAAVECHQGVSRMSSDIDGTSFYIATGQCAKAIRALKINTGD